MAASLASSMGASSSSDSVSGVPILVRAFHPLPATLSFNLPPGRPVRSILDGIVKHLSLSPDTSSSFRLTRCDGRTVNRKTNAGALLVDTKGHNASHPVLLDIRLGLKGGKGGFGSMLRAQGGKMSSNRNGEENNDSCRDLNGRRLSTVKQARQLALYLENQDERERELSETQRKKYEKLEKMLGRKPKGEADFVEAAQKLHEEGGYFEDGTAGEDGNAEASTSASTSANKGAQSSSSTTQAAYAGKKRDRIEDTEYLEQSREIVDNVRSAVASAMMKKKKKQKVGAKTTSTTSTNTTAQSV